jgi:adenylate cyclase
MTNRRFRFDRISEMLVISWAIASAGVTILNPLGLARLLELQTQTLFFQARGTVDPPPSIIILAMDEDSLTQGVNFGHLKDLEPIRTYPWRRVAYAKVIDRLMAAGAKSVAVDVVFDAPSDRPEDDQALQQTLQRHAGKITLAALEATSQSGGGGLEQLIYPDPLFQTTPRSIGLINSTLEPNDQYRRFAWVYVQSISADLRQSQPDLTSFTEATLKAANQPFSKTKGDYLFFYGGQNTFPQIPFWRVLDRAEWQKLKQEQTFKNKIVLLGPTAAYFQDFHFTPFGRNTGIEIHANAIATLIENRAIRELMPNPFWRGGFVFLGIISTGLALSWRFQRSMLRSLAALGCAGLWVGIGYLCFTHLGWIVPVTIPSLAIALSGLSFLSTGALRDLLEKLRLRRTLERYVAAPIVQEILSQPENYQALLQGRKLKAAVLFCDIRGFTTLSYIMSPEQLVAQLNVYLDAMVAVIVNARGTIDKFIGDAIMAEFGSPVSQGEKADAMNAIHAALQMRVALANLRQQWQQEGKALFYNGIGISYGEVVAGNIGSLQRLEYTVIGDTVNVASRVEGLTKSFMTDILITEALYDIVQDEIEVVCVGEQALRGREELTRLYSVIGLKNNDLSLYHQVHKELRQHLEQGLQED